MSHTIRTVLAVPSLIVVLAGLPLSPATAIGLPGTSAGSAASDWVRDGSLTPALTKSARTETRGTEEALDTLRAEITDLRAELKSSRSLVSTK